MLKFSDEKLAEVEDVFKEAIQDFEKKITTIDNKQTTLNIKSILKEKNYTIELLKENGQVYRALKNTEKFKFELIEVGNYTLRVLIDPNKNGEWDIGSITNLVEPESIIVYDKKIEVKANWDVEDIVIYVDK